LEGNLDCVKIKIMTNTRHYHHGDLAAALLDAAQDELADKGIEGFSLRGVAKRAGVSHAAPAHHFKDVQHLLTAVAARGFERFVQKQSDFRRQAGPEPGEQLVASGVGYVMFAWENPALFRLMFGSCRPDFGDPDLAHTAGRAYDDLVQQVTMASGRRHPEVEPAEPGSQTNEPVDDPGLAINVAASWAIAHGLADLLVAGRLQSIGSLAGAQQLDAIAAVLRQGLKPLTGQPT
jgi:AcrR family transcriptional regulator